jgi:hypothetical protein
MTRWVLLSNEKGTFSNKAEPLQTSFLRI